MEPRKRETCSEACSADKTSSPRQEVKKHRFQIVKLEERIAPAKPGQSHTQW
jgi:hypothetical protein